MEGDEERREKSTASLSVEKHERKTDQRLEGVIEGGGGIEREFLASEHHPIYEPKERKSSMEP